MSLIFDTHAHYTDEAFNEDREVILSGLKSNGVGMVMNACAAFGEIEGIVELINTHDFIYGSVGVHPSEVHDLTDASISSMEEALKHPKMMAVGEIGLDYHYEDTDKAEQKLWFVKQIDLAKRCNYPIMIHSRDAAADTLDIVKAEKADSVGGVVHCFSYETEMAKIYLDMGFYIGIGGVLTYKNARKLVEVAQMAPLDRIVLETDCPYLSPVPNRGKRNDSSNLNFVAQKLAEIKGLPVGDVIDATFANAINLYKI